ncbi:prophage antirepressor-like protein [Clostridium moniliforme]|uniref:Prophage antirepressor-like protein n=1 Tax=Clostridium moniliforme TaxID=39489 RepID=A0ABS4F0R5_9CLOT|nr:phage antirepressor KilAC domain-containing protein [Clostridium moniliforme]MBP1889837.1 prophage antirepressor-like protein [Clostridium moniliforme]
MNNLIILEEREVLGKDFKIYGTKENPLFLAKDVANWIEHSRASEMLKSIDEEEKLMQTIFASGQNREMWFLTEDGLYEVLMQSRKPIAKQFKKEVKKILKQIRKTGGYIPLEDEMDDEEFMARALEVAHRTLKKKEELLKTKTKELEEKNRFLNQISASSNSILVRDVAHLVTKQNIKIGEKRLWNKLREWGLIQKGSTKPMQRALEQGLFEKSEFIIQRSHGVETKYTTRVTGKGQVYIINKLIKEINS